MKWLAVILAGYFFFLGMTARAQTQGRSEEIVIVETDFHSAVRDCEASKDSISEYHHCLVEHIRNSSSEETSDDDIRLAVKLHKIVRSIEIEWRLKSIFSWDTDYIVREGLGDQQAFPSRIDAERYRDARALELLEQRLRKRRRSRNSSDR